MEGQSLEELMRGAREFRDKMDRTRDAIHALEVEGEAGGGMVRVVVGGDRTVRRVEISDEAMGDKAMLQDLVASAMADANRKLEEKISDQFRRALPPGFTGLPI